MEARRWISPMATQKARTRGQRSQKMISCELIDLSLFGIRGPTSLGVAPTRHDPQPQNEFET